MKAPLKLLLYHHFSGTGSTPEAEQEDVKDVRFAKRVVVHSVRVVAPGENPHQGLVNFVGQTSPNTINIEIWAREARNTEEVPNGCAAELVNLTSTPLSFALKKGRKSRRKELQRKDVITDHIFIRGKFRLLSLCMYGHVEESQNKVNYAESTNNHLPQPFPLKPKLLLNKEFPEFDTKKIPEPCQPRSPDVVPRFFEKVNLTELLFCPKIASSYSSLDVLSRELPSSEQLKRCIITARRKLKPKALEKLSRLVERSDAADIPGNEMADLIMDLFKSSKRSSLVYQGSNISQNLSPLLCSLSGKMPTEVGDRLLESGGIRTLVKLTCQDKRTLIRTAAVRALVSLLSYPKAMKVFLEGIDHKHKRSKTGFEMVVSFLVKTEDIATPLAEYLTRIFEMAAVYKRALDVQEAVLSGKDKETQGEVIENLFEALVTASNQPCSSSMRLNRSTYSAKGGRNPYLPGIILDFHPPLPSWAIAYLRFLDLAPLLLVGLQLASEKEPTQSILGSEVVGVILLIAQSCDGMRMLCANPSTFRELLLTLDRDLKIKEEDITVMTFLNINSPSLRDLIRLKDLERSIESRHFANVLASQARAMVLASHLRYGTRPISQKHQAVLHFLVRMSYSQLGRDSVAKALSDCGGLKYLRALCTLDNMERLFVEDNSKDIRDIIHDTTRSLQNSAWSTVCGELCLVLCNSNHVPHQALLEERGMKLATALQQLQIMEKQEIGNGSQEPFYGKFTSCLAFLQPYVAITTRGSNALFQQLITITKSIDIEVGTPNVSDLKDPSGQIYSKQNLITLLSGLRLIEAMIEVAVVIQAVVQRDFFSALQRIITSCGYFFESLNPSYNDWALPLFERGQNCQTGWNLYARTTTVALRLVRIAFNRCRSVSFPMAYPPLAKPCLMLWKKLASKVWTMDPLGPTGVDGPLMVQLNETEDIMVLGDSTLCNLRDALASVLSHTLSLPCQNLRVFRHSGDSEETQNICELEGLPDNHPDVDLETPFDQIEKFLEDILLPSSVLSGVLILRGVLRTAREDDLVDVWVQRLTSPKCEPLLVGLRDLVIAAGEDFHQAVGWLILEICTLSPETADAVLSPLFDLLDSKLLLMELNENCSTTLDCAERVLRLFYWMLERSWEVPSLDPRGVRLAFRNLRLTRTLLPHLLNNRCQPIIQLLIIRVVRADCSLCGINPDWQYQMEMSAFIPFKEDIDDTLQAIYNLMSTAINGEEKPLHFRRQAAFQALMSLRALVGIGQTLPGLKAMLLSFPQNPLPQLLSKLLNQYRPGSNGAIERQELLFECFVYILVFLESLLYGPRQPSIVADKVAQSVEITKVENGSLSKKRKRDETSNPAGKRPRFQNAKLANNEKILRHDVSKRNDHSEVWAESWKEVIPVGMRENFLDVLKLASTQLQKYEKTAALAPRYQEVFKILTEAKPVRTEIKLRNWGVNLKLPTSSVLSENLTNNHLYKRRVIPSPALLPKVADKKQNRHNCNSSKNKGMKKPARKIRQMPRTNNYTGGRAPSIHVDNFQMNNNRMVRPPRNRMNVRY